MKHYVFVVEGCDGTGKTTTVSRVVDKLRQLGTFDVYPMSPSNNAYGKEVKRILKELKPTIETERLLQTTTFYETERLIRTLQKASESNGRNSITILDRWYDSFFAYQEFPFVKELEEVYEFYQHHPLISIFDIDAIFILEADEQLIFDRIKSRGEERDKYEQEDALRETILAYNFISKAKDYRKDNMQSLRLNFTMDEETVAQEAYNYFTSFIQEITE